MTLTPDNFPEGKTQESIILPFVSSQARSHCNDPPVKVYQRLAVDNLVASDPIREPDTTPSSITGEPRVVSLGGVVSPLVFRPSISSPVTSATLLFDLPAPRSGATFAFSDQDASTRKKDTTTKAKASSIMLPLVYSGPSALGLPLPRVFQGAGFWDFSEGLGDHLKSIGGFIIKSCVFFSEEPEPDSKHVFAALPPPFFVSGVAPKPAVKAKHNAVVKKKPMKRKPRTEERPP